MEVDIRHLNYLVTYYLDAVENIKNNNPAAEHNYPFSADIKKPSTNIQMFTKIQIMKV